ncbi:phosphoribosylanthranilate isomerase [Tabrizicola thermarum]|uniref:phosphoribosylanthranilate isomerase n=1 Tax=Tabrizicola thermarum TaxID=2670345 RepID=UPI000FFB4282|nr:phosphoribosylanthranilate isomerase [Tabrizicola thermarum]
MREVRVKICGLKTPEDVAAVAKAGAAYAGFNFFARSPRHVSPGEARALALIAPEGLCKVALVVDADDAALDAIVEAVPLDMLQLHGRETPARVAEIKARYGLPVMKVIGVAVEADLAPLLDYQLVADQILVDAKAPKDAVLPGGNGLTFDWRLLVGRKWLKPWMLAGGLTPENVGQAIQRTGARQVDVASGVESAPGVKDAGRIAAFVEAAQGVRGGVPILR